MPGPNIPWKNLRRFTGKFLKQPGYAARVALQRVLAMAAYHCGRGYSIPPESLTLFLTHACNLRCKMCGQWGEHGVTKTQDAAQRTAMLPVETLSSLIDALSAFRPSITLFGGEPLLYPRCLDLIRHIKKNNMHCVMITNASLVQSNAAPLVDSGLDELNVSLDGGEARHDAIRGVPGLFRQITQGLRELNTYKRSCGRKTPLINLQCTITKYNYQYLEEMTDVAAYLNADSLTYHNLIFLGHDLLDQQKSVDAELGCSSKSWEGFVVEAGIDPEILYAKMRAILGRTYPFAVDFYPNLSRRGLTEYYQNPSYLPAEYPRRCLSPWVVAYVFPDGTVRPCLNSTYAYGDIKSQAFTRIWNSDAARAYRRRLKKTGLFPACVRCTELYRY